MNAAVAPVANPNLFGVNTEINFISIKVNPI